MIDLNSKDLPLPKHVQGTKKDFQDSIVLHDIQEAKDFYIKAKANLLDVNNWGKLCADSGATFELTDEKGTRVDCCPQKGHYFKIDIPGPGAVAGKGYDWVQVEAVHDKNDIEADTEYIIIRVRPASNPTTADDHTAHFFSDQATSNFLVLREGAEVTAAVLGRNEITNTEKDNSIIDTIRNFVVATSAKIGLANPQWKNLIEGILAKKNRVV